MTDFATIDKLTTTLFAYTPKGDDAADAAAIISAFSALQRKIRAANIDVHKIRVRVGEQPKMREPRPINTYNASVAQEALDKERAEHEATKLLLKEAREQLFDLHGQQQPDADILTLIQQAVQIDRRAAQKEIVALQTKLDAVAAALAA